MKRFKESGFIFYENKSKLLRVHRTLFCFLRPIISALGNKHQDSPNRPLSHLSASQRSSTKQALALIDPNWAVVGDMAIFRQLRIAPPTGGA